MAKRIILKCCLDDSNCLGCGKPRRHTFESRNQVHDCPALVREEFQEPEQDEVVVPRLTPD